MYYYVLYYLSLLHARDGFVWAYYKNGDDTINYFFLLSSHKCIICNGIKSEIRIHFFYVWPKELAELEKVNNYFSNIGIFIFGEEDKKK